MSMLDKVNTGKRIMAHLILVHGPDGAGKTTFGSEAPNVIFLGPERGSDNLDVSRFPTPEKWSDVQDSIKELTVENHNYKTLVIDSLDWLEPLLFAKICQYYGVNSIEKAAGGYGKGYSEAKDQWIEFQQSLSNLRETKKMNIICIAHSQVSEFNDPTTEASYNRYELKLFRSSNGNTDCRAIWREFVDLLIFMNNETVSKGEGKEARGISTEARIMHTVRDARWDAKSRYLGFPSSIPMEIGQSWDRLDKAIKASQTSTPIQQESEPEVKPEEGTVERLKKLASAVKDEGIRAKALKSIDDNANNPKMLQAIESRLAVINE